MHTADNTTGFYPARVALRMPAEMQEAVTVAARLQLTTPSEYLRRAVLLALRTDGVMAAAGRHAVAHQPEVRP
jgi:hypothetical protein